MCILIDLFNREIIGYSAGPKKDEMLAKTEFANWYIFKSLEELNIELADYVNWYNNVRIHSTLSYLKPVEFKRYTLKKIV